jgi:hypothetical protein
MVYDASGLHQPRRMGRKHHVVSLREDPENDACFTAVGCVSPDSPHTNHQLSTTECRTGPVYRGTHISLQFHLLRCLELRVSFAYRKDALAGYSSHDTGLRTIFLPDNDVLRKNLDGWKTDFVEKFMSAARILQAGGRSEAEVSCTRKVVRDAAVCNVRWLAQPLSEQGGPTSLYPTTDLDTDHCHLRIVQLRTCLCPDRRRHWSTRAS